ncbi:MAG: MFS transporter [Elusimicrobia bacterium]|nr:MFS transporter [Elusimicrobiota bacterium]
MTANPYHVLGILFLVNLLNYIDRQVLYAVFPLIKPDLGLSDTQLGALASAFMLVYMCAAPFAGYKGDRSDRGRWIAGGVGLWSLATVFSGLSRTYGQLLGARSFVGIGEACYGSLSPSFIAERFRADQRARVLGFFSMAIPVGSALGYVFGGQLGQRFGWRAAFFIVGAPGLLAAALTLLLRDPRTDPGAAGGSPLAAAPRAANALPEGAPGARPLGLPAQAAPAWADYAALFKNKVFIADTLAGAAMTFAVGGLAAWMPSYFVRSWHMSVGDAGLWFGGVTVAAGTLGSLAGGWLGDWALRRTKKAYFLVTGAGFVLSIPFGVAMLSAPDRGTAFACLFAAEFLIFMNNGPLNALLVDCTPVSIRSMAFAANIFFIHAFGDALSPALIGYVSDLSSLKTGILMTVGALFVAGLFCFWGTRYMDEVPERPA